MRTLLILLFFFLASVNSVHGQESASKRILKLDENINNLIPNNPDKALELAKNNYEQALKNSTDPYLKAKVLITLGLANNRLDNIPAAFESFTEAADLLKDKNASEDLVKTYNLIGGLYYNIAEFQKTIEYTQLAIKSAENLDYQIPTSHLYNNLAGAYLKLDQHKKALFSANRALELAYQYDSPDQLLYAYGTLGEIFTGLGKYDSATIYLNKSYQLGVDEKIITPLEESFLNIDLAISSLGAKDTLLAYKYALRAYKIADTSRFLRFKKEAAQLLSQIWQDWGNTDSMMMYSNSANRINDSLWSLEKQLQLNKMIIKSREEEIKANVQEAKQQKLFFIISLIFIVALLITSISLVRAYKNSRRLVKQIRSQSETIEKTNKKLSQQKRELQQLHDTKDRIFSMVVHDFKTPLHTLESLLILISNEHLTREESIELAKKAGKNIKKSKDSINNLITWAKNQLNGLSVNFQKIHLEEFFMEVKDYHEQQALDKEITLELEVKQEEKTIISDKEILFIILNNLISNSIKFSNVNSIIKVAIGRKENKYVWTVSDNGIGIKQEHLKILFSYNRSPSRGTHNEPGSRLGLIIVKELVELLKGDISVKSQYGKGTTFIIELPVKEVNKQESTYNL